jgi:hypothetical protein
VVGLEVRHVPLEQVQVAVDGISQAQLLDQEMDGTDAPAVQALRLVPDLVVDVAVAEHASALLGPLLVAEAAAYLSLHLKYLPVRGEGNLVTSPFPRKCRGISSFFMRPSRQEAGDTLVLGLAGGPGGRQ